MPYIVTPPPSSPPGPINNSSQLTRLHAILEALHDSQSKKRKYAFNHIDIFHFDVCCRRNHNQPHLIEVDAYKKTGKWIPRGFHPFVNLGQAFEIGIQIAEDPDDEIPTSNSPMYVYMHICYSH